MIERQEGVVRKARERAGDLAHGLETPLTILQGEARRLESGGNRNSAALLNEQVNLMRRHVDRELARARTLGTTAAAGTMTDAHKTIARLIDLVGRMPRAEAITWGKPGQRGLARAHGPRRFWRDHGQLARRRAQMGDFPSARWRRSARRRRLGRRRRRLPRRRRRRSIWASPVGERANTDGEGTGLGLAIVTDVLAQYNSVLTIEASPQGGCRAKFSAPT